MEIVLPETPPAYGQETAEWILDTIREHPELHDQDSWWGYSSMLQESDDEKAFYSCSTTHCIAGWAALLHKDLTEQIASSMPNMRPDNTAAYILTLAIPKAAIIALGIDAQEGDDLFTSRDEVALEALGYLAEGKAIDWEHVRGVKFDPEGYDLP